MQPTKDSLPLSTFGARILDFHSKLQIPDILLPEGFEWLYPHNSPATRQVMEAFYTKYYNDDAPRHVLLGINPGRFGAGVTGIPFTDPVRLEADCDITNPFDKKQELSAQFVWAFIRAFGGPEAFCREFYITSVSPLGFIKNGININYYDDRQLIKAVEPFALWNLRTQIEIGLHTDYAISMGEGANFQFLKKLNAKHGLFREIIPLPHPRWVLQYRRKDTQVYLDAYLQAFARMQESNR